jgi:hypothetical protein
MHFVEKCPEDLVYSKWFINEAKGRLSKDVERFLCGRPHYRVLIEKPNFQSEYENRRRAILNWVSRGIILFELPLDIEWHVGEISEKEFGNLFVITNNWWSKNYGSGSSRLSVVSENVHMKNQNACIRSMVDDVSCISRDLILIGRKRGPYTIIDGVHRAIALYIHYFLLAKDKFIPFRLFVGVSPTKCIWESCDNSH